MGDFNARTGAEDDREDTLSQLPAGFNPLSQFCARDPLRQDKTEIPK
jgi:hypothetical protein